MSKRASALRAAGWVTVGVVAAGGVGVAAASTGGGSAAKPAITTADTSTTPVKGKHGGHRRALAGKLGSRVLHGQETLLGKDGKPVVVAEQRGTVDAVNATSITLTSKDGFKQTYVVNADTRVRVAGKKSTIAAVKPGDTAGVLAKVNGSTQTATFVIERPAKPASAPTTS
jgi:hypothetical protein